MSGGRSVAPPNGTIIGAAALRRMAATARPEKSAQRLTDSAAQMEGSALHMERDTERMTAKADRRTELAADRTVFAAERTYAAWVRTGLVSLASGIGAKVTKVTMVSPSQAKVTYSILIGGQPALSNQSGVAVYQDGTWKVGLASFCGLLALENGGKTSGLPAACKSAG